MWGCNSQPQPCTPGLQHPFKQAQGKERKGRHSPGSQQQPGGERETGRQQGQKVLLNLYPSLTKQGKSSKIPLNYLSSCPLLPHEQDLRPPPVSWETTPVPWEGGLSPNKGVPLALEFGCQPVAPLGASLPGSRLAPTSLPTSARGTRGRAALLTKHSVVPGQVAPGWLIPVHVMPGSLCAAG